MMPDNYELCRIIEDLQTIFTFEEIISMINESAVA